MRRREDGGNVAASIVSIHAFLAQVPDHLLVVFAIRVVTLGMKWPPKMA
jgi:hypothetical protein